MADVSTIVGSTEAIEQPIRREWSASDGWQTIRSWMGPYAAVEALANEFSTTTSGVDSMSLDKNGVEGILTTRINDDPGTGTGGSVALANATWELILNEMMKPLRHSSYFDTGSAAIKTEYAQILDAFNQGQIASFSTTSNQGTVFKAALIAGISDTMVAAPVLRQTMIVSRRNEVNVIVADAFTVKTSATILALIPVDFIWRSVLHPTTGTFKDYTWLQKLPTFRRIGRSRFEIGLEYWGAEKWVKYFYSGGTDDLGTGVAYP